MDLPTAVIEMRLATALAAARGLPPGAAGAAQRAAFWHSLSGLSAVLRRALRQFDPIDQACSTPTAALDAELGRLHLAAARLASQLLAARRLDGATLGAELAHAVQQLGTAVGRPLDAALLGPALQTAALLPMHASLAPAPADTQARTRVDALFIVFAMVLVLSRPPRAAPA